MKSKSANPPKQHPHIIHIVTLNTHQPIPQ
jgi:hypothetical protein